MRLFLSSLVCCALAGCSSLPRYDNPITGGVTPADVVRSIECELIEAMPVWVAARHNDVVRGYMIAVAEMTLQVDEQTTLAPSFTHTGVSTAAFSRVFNWGAKLDQTANRTYTEAVVFALDPKEDWTAARKSCRDVVRRGPHTITSQLGLAEVVERGVSSQTAHGRIAGIGSSLEPAKGKTAFGQSVNFVVTMNVNGVGPTWTLQNFKGPGPMLLAQRQDTHKVIISFADLDPTKPNPLTRTERYLRAICAETAKKIACEDSRPAIPPSSGQKSGRWNTLTLKPRAAGSQSHDTRAFDDAVNAARENNQILRLQSLGTILGQ